MAAISEPTAIIEIDQRGQLQNVAKTSVRWLITTGENGQLTVEYNTDNGWNDFGTIDAEDVILHDNTFNNDRWNILEWTNTDCGAHYRLSITGPHKDGHDTYYNMCIQKRTHNEPDNEAYLTVQRVRLTHLPEIIYPSRNTD